MHAFLIVGRAEKKANEQVEKLGRKLKAEILEFPLEKIADVRDLSSFTKLELNKRTAIYIKGIDKATIPALNAFLKNLEEPQENLFYILTCTNKHALPPTIVSRCQIIRTVDSGQLTVNSESAKKFLGISAGEKLETTSKIRARDEAIGFVEKLILSLHSLLIQETKDQLKISKSIQSANSTLINLRANGNVQLQLTNFIINLAN